MMSRLVFGPEQVAGAFAVAFLGLFGVMLGLVGSLGVEEPYDKLVHATFFLLLATALFFTGGRRASAAALLAFAIGVAGELLQLLTPMHTVSVLDVGANGIGIGIFLLAATPTAPARRLWRARRSRQVTAHFQQRRSYAR